MYCKNCNKLLTYKQQLKKNMFCSKACATSYRCRANDPDVFDIQNDDIKFYLLGLLFTDGNLNKEENRLTLSLTSKETIEYLYPFFSDINKRKIYHYTPLKGNSNTSYTILNTNSSCIRKIKDLGLFPCNSNTKNFPTIEKKYLASFLRGIFDGDGCIYVSTIKRGKKYFAISFTCGSYDFTQGICNSLKQLGMTPTVSLDCRRKNNKNKTYYIHLYKEADIKTFYSTVYAVDNISIKYKKERFREVI